MNETKAERGLQVVANLATILSAMRVIAYIVVVFGLPLMALKALPLLNRLVVVVERMDERVERAFEGAAPAGKALVEKGAEAANNVDAKALGAEITDATRRLLRKGDHKEQK